MDWRDYVETAAKGVAHGFGLFLGILVAIRLCQLAGVLIHAG